MNLISLDNPTRTHDSVSWNSDFLKGVYNQHYDLVPEKNLHFGGRPQRLQMPGLQEAFLYVASETTYDYPYAFITEKSFKGILCKRPFVILGSPGSLRCMQELGFKTFDRWWDESYDNLDDPTERILAITDIVKYVSSLSSESIQKMCIEMEDVLEYNFNYYMKDMMLSGLNDFKQQLDNC